MKPRSVYVCQACGYQAPKWLGRCPGCQAWSTLIEEIQASAPTPATAASGEPFGQPVALSRVVMDTAARVTTGIEELDRVLGGGLTTGSLVLVGGDPGIGKSTLLLQAVGQLTRRGQRALYLSAEESLAQIKMRAERLGVASDTLFLLSDTRIEALDAAIEQLQPAVIVVDSIQTVGVSELESAIGSVAQIRAVTQHLMHIAKGRNIATFVVGHVTKDGTIAGPKVMEHMVDTVLYFEGERTGPFRILRAHKNRFGSAQEIGIFEMQVQGLVPVANPSALFLSQRATAPGAVVITSMEGSRPLLLEIQALTAPAVYGTARRTAVGFDPQRVAMLCAVLDRRAGLETGNMDIYINVAGGVRISEPAADLGVILALASTVRNIAVPTDVVVIGEVGLAGEIRGASYLPARIQEAQRLGFSRCVVPKIDVERWQGPKARLPLTGVERVSAALAAVDLQ